MSKFLKQSPKLLAAAAALTIAGLAQAEVSVYGLIDMSYGKNEVVDGKGIKADIHSGGDSSSSQGNSVTRFGIAVSNEVAAGIKANAKLESAGITSDGALNAGALFDRQAWAGLSGGFGEVRVGRQDSVSFQTHVGYDFNGYSNSATALGYTSVAAHLPGRQSRSVQYISPVVAGGLKVQVGFQPEGNVAGDKANYGIGATYAVGAFSVSASAESKRTDTGEDVAALSASYDFGVAKVMASYGDNGTNKKGAGLGVVAPVAGFNVGAIYANNSDTKDTGLELFVNREIFKNTFAYAEALRYEIDATGESRNNYAVGVIFAF